MNTKLREGSSLYCSFLHKTRNYAVPRAIFDSPTPIIRKAKTCKLVAKTQETQEVVTQSRKKKQKGGAMDLWIKGWIKVEPPRVCRSMIETGKQSGAGPMLRQISNSWFPLPSDCERVNSARPRVKRGANEDRDDQ